MDRLRSETRALHDRLESLPYAKAALDGTLAVDSYTGFLRALYVVHEAFEGLLQHSVDARVHAVWSPEMQKLPLLARDLADLGIDLRQVDVPTLRAELLAQKMRLLALQKPASVLGMLYVLEGSTLGGVVQRAALAKRPELEAGGLSYLAGYGKDTRWRFEELLGRLDAVLARDGDLAQAIAGAAATFEGLEAVLATLSPLAPSSNDPCALDLNPEAGKHPVPSDLREIEAALRAGEASWDRFPYYEARYGERGRRFTRSDSAWLATLGRGEPLHVHKHVRWLGGILARRGMPRFLLEQHLFLLEAALVRAVPEEPSAYAVLGNVARTLEYERERAISPARHDELAAAFDAMVGPGLAAALPGSGKLLVAAVADERCGIDGAVDGLVSWLGDPKRFATAWVNAVRRTVAAARLP